MTVRVDGRTVFRVWEGGGTIASDRARRIQRRLNTLLETPAAIVPARVEASGDTSRMVSVAGVPVVTVTQTDAEDNVAGLDALGAQWAGSVDRVLLRARDRRTTAWARFTSEVQASVHASFARLVESAIRIVPRFLAALLVLGLFWTLGAGIRLLMRAVFRRVVDDLTVENLIKQFTYYAVWILGLIVAVDALGFDPHGRLVLVRNAEVFTSRVTNNTASPVRRGSVRVFPGIRSRPPAGRGDPAGGGAEGARSAGGTTGIRSHS